MLAIAYEQYRDQQMITLKDLFQELREPPKRAEGDRRRNMWTPEVAAMMLLEDM